MRALPDGATPTSRRGRERVVQDGGFERILSHDRVLEEGFDRHDGSWSCIAEVYVVAERFTQLAHALANRLDLGAQFGSVR